MAVKVVTDSTADLPQSLARELDLTVIPLNIHFGTQVYRDGIDLGSDEFFRRLVSSPRVPTTSQPSVGDFLDVYRHLAREASGIVSVHISAKLSGTINSATQALHELGASCPVEVVDGLSVSVGTGLVAVAAARAARAGGTLAEVAEAARRAAAALRLFIVLDTLEYLQKGGRIGKAQAFLGTLLRVKPILTCRDGELHPLERARTRVRAVERVYELAQEHRPFAMAAVAHSTTPDEAEGLAARLRPLCTGEVIVSRLGATVGVHAGPGALGIAVQTA